MYSAIRLKLLMIIFIASYALGIGVAWALHCLGSAVVGSGWQTPWNWSYLWAGIGLGVLLLSALGHSRCIDRLWKWFPSLNRWVAPNLNGRFRLENRSNFAIKKQMLGAYDSHPFSKLPPHEVLGAGVYGGTLRIQMGLLTLKATYEPEVVEASRSRSHVVAFGLQPPAHGRSDFRLSYVFVGETLDHSAATDEATYNGAASLSVPTDPHKPMEGTYWTNRAFKKGLNTAGYVSATRL